MENATYALKMAAGILLAILLVSLLSFAVRQGGRINEALVSEKILEENKKFNDQFLVYDKVQMYGTDVLSCINLAYDLNEQSNVWGEAALKDNKIDVIARLKTPLSSEIKVYYFNENVQKEMQVGTGYEAKSSQNIGEVLPIELKEYFEYSLRRNVTYSDNVVTAANTFAETRIRKIQVEKPLNPEMQKLVPYLGYPDITVKNKKYNPNNNNWTKLVWVTPTSDLKQRHFKCTNIEYNNVTGRIVKVEFQEI